MMVTLNQCSIIATLNIIETDLLKPNEASLSNQAWTLLSAKEGDEITVTHPNRGLAEPQLPPQPLAEADMIGTLVGRMAGLLTKLPI